MDKKPIVLAITGASGSIYGFTLLKFFLANDFRVDLVISSNGDYVAYKEIGLDIREKSLEQKEQMILDFIGLSDNTNLRIWEQSNVAASISSGSYQTQGMIVAPCSVGSVGNIAAGTSNNLITRAADVILKERRKLVLLVREMPFNSIHLNNMKTLSDCGAMILPATPAFYQNPQTIQDQINFVCGKTLDAFGIENGMFKRWSGDANIVPKYQTA